MTPSASAGLSPEGSTSNRAFSEADSDAVYALAQRPSKLGQQVKHALAIVEESLVKFGLNQMGLSFNGGKDCTVLIHLLAAAAIRHQQRQQSHSTSPFTSSTSALPTIQSVYIRCTSPFPQVESFVTVCVERYNLELQIAEGNMRDALESYLVGREKENGEEGKILAVMVGTRRNDPHGAKLKDFDRTDHGWPDFVRVHPILDWDYATIWEFLREPSLTLGQGNVEWCEMYNYGYTSLGSTHNTFPNPHLRSQDSASSLVSFRPAWELEDGEQERAGREARPLPVSSPGFLSSSASNGSPSQTDGGPILEREVAGVNGR